VLYAIGGWSLAGLIRDCGCGHDVRRVWAMEAGEGALRDVSGTVPDGAAAVAATRVCAPSPVFPQLSCCSFVRCRFCHASPKNTVFFTIDYAYRLWFSF